MTITIDIHTGKIVIHTSKFDSGGIDFSDLKPKSKPEIFPLKEDEIDNIEFYPKDEKKDTPRLRALVKKYLEDEDFIRPGGNITINSVVFAQA